MEAKVPWKKWLETALHKTKGKLHQVQARYKRSYDNFLRRQKDKILPDVWVFLRVERRDKREHRYKLAVVEVGPYGVDDVPRSTIFIE